MRKHEVSKFPKTLMYFNKRLHFVLDEFVKGLVFEPEEYAPILNVLYDGNLKYVKVTPYNQKWLPRDADGILIPDHKRVSFEPAPVWTEDRWIFCRRMNGDEICQILFYHLATFIWVKNKLSDEQINEHQLSLLTTVFNVSEIREFKEKLETPVSVTTWDGQTRVWMSVDQVDRMYREMCLLGPMAAMFGREVQQTLMSPQPPTKIPVEDFQYSVNSGRASLSQDRIARAWNEPADAHREDDRGSQTSKRTRSPRKMPYHGAIWEQPDCRQATDIREKSGARQSTDVRERHDDRRPMDIRERHDDRRPMDIRERHDDRRSMDVRDRSDYRHHGEPRDSVRERRSHAQSETRYDRDNKDRFRRY